MTQRWTNLLFAHWRVPADRLRGIVPSLLPLDTFDGSAWITVAPFLISDLHGRGLPPLPGASRFPEINVRTYVTLEGKPGVYFFSLDAGNAAAVAGARLAYHLPYFRASMRIDATMEGGFRFTSRRTHRGAPAADFDASYRATGAAYQSASGSLDEFLTERYCLYAVDDRRLVYRADIHHVPWHLQPATVEIPVNTMGSAAGIDLEGPPERLAYAERIDVLVWWPERVRTG